MTRPEYLKTQIFLDSGNPTETKQMVELLGYLDGQTTNPSLVAKNPHISEMKDKGLLQGESIWQEYRTVAEQIHEILPNGSISVEVYADATTSYEDMLEQGRKLATWFPGIFVKLPTTQIGLSVAHVLVAENINVNMTLCFSQDQAAAVHMATRGAKRGQVYVSPFIGRLDDIGLEGRDIIGNILRMYRQWDSHVMVLGASIRSLDHLFYCFQNETDIITAPLSILQSWAVYGLEKDPKDYELLVSDKTRIAYKDLHEQDWTLYDIHHDLTEKGIEKFSMDWKSLFN